MTTKEQCAANAEVMGQHMTAYEASGLSVLEYCKEKHLSVHRFNYWLYRRREKRAASKHKGFSRVMPQAAGTLSSIPTSRQPTVEVILPNGNRVAFFDPNSLDLFKALL